MFLWWHPMLATFVGSIVAVFYCLFRGVDCDECRKLSKEVAELRDALTTDRQSGS